MPFQAYRFNGDTANEPLTTNGYEGGNNID